MWFYKEGTKIDEQAQLEMMKKLIEEAKKRKSATLNKVLLLPPDKTRYYSGSGKLTNMLYHILMEETEGKCQIDVIPTLGQHHAHTPEENKWMFGDIPEECIHKHDWINSVVKIGEISGDFLKIATDGKADWPMPIEIHKAVVSGEYDLIINIGQIVPHEVLGFGNHNKNYFIGLGGKGTITTSHIGAAVCGIENNLGQIISPMRACFNLAQKKFMSDVPDVFILIVQDNEGKDGSLQTSGLFIGDDNETYLAAAKYARKQTVHIFDKPIKKVVCLMDEREFNSTWVANKAVYRTRKVIADDGELVVIAPGVERFGEKEEVDRMTRKYGYKGTPNALRAYNEDPELHELGHAAAHLSNGSSEGRFKITYAPGHLTKEEIEGVGYEYMDINEAIAKYNPEKLKPGFNVVDGEEIFFVNTPTLGLWTAKDKYIDALKNNMSFIDKMIENDPDEEIWKEIKKLNELDLASLQ